MKKQSFTSFALFYVSVISVALFSSIYASSLNAWNRVVFTFPPETQRVVENGTAVMEIRWRWFPETLEVIVKVNDDDFNQTPPHVTDSVALLFDSDNNEFLTGQPGYNWTLWTLQDEIDDHGVVTNDLSISVAFNKAFILHTQEYGNGRVSELTYWMIFEYPHQHPNFIAYVNNSYCTYKEGEGYTFNLSIPKTLISVEPPTPIHISFTDSDVWWREIYTYNSYKDTIFANFTG